MRRDQSSGQELHVSDADVSDKQHDLRKASHLSSAKYEAGPNASPVILPCLQVGDKVYLKSDKSKSKARDPHIVLSIDTTKKEAQLQKSVKIM